MSDDTPKRSLPSLHEKAQALRSAISIEPDSADVRVYLFCFSCDVLSRQGTRQTQHRLTCARRDGSSATEAEAVIYRDHLELRIGGVNDSRPVGHAQKTTDLHGYAAWVAPSSRTHEARNLRRTVIALLWAWLSSEVPITKRESRNS